MLRGPSYDLRFYQFAWKKRAFPSCACNTADTNGRYEILGGKCRYEGCVNNISHVSVWFCLRTTDAATFAAAADLIYHESACQAAYLRLKYPNDEPDVVPSTGQQQPMNLPPPPQQQQQPFGVPQVRTSLVLCSVVPGSIGLLHQVRLVFMCLRRCTANSGGRALCPNCFSIWITFSGSRQRPPELVLGSPSSLRAQRGTLKRAPCTCLRQRICACAERHDAERRQSGTGSSEMLICTLYLSV